MKAPVALRVYVVGWRNFVMSFFQVILWNVIMSLPLLLLMILGPDSAEGTGQGAWFMRPLAVALMLLWVPLMSYMLGELVFKSEIRKRRKERTGIDEELKLLSRATGDGGER